MLLFPATNISIIFKGEIMNLPNPVTIQPPTIVRSNSEVRVQKPITLVSLDVTIIDNAKRRSCVVQLRPCPYPLILWEGDDYDTVGDYTQAQVESRVLELLGSDIKNGLEKLFTVSNKKK